MLSSESGKPSRRDHQSGITSLIGSACRAFEGNVKAPVTNTSASVPAVKECPKQTQWVQLDLF